MLDNQAPDGLGLSATTSQIVGPAREDERLVSAMHEYLAEVEAGRKPARAEFLARYPEIAAELADCLEGLDFVHAAGAHDRHERESARHLSGTRHPSSPIPQDTAELPLGDYRIVREVGQGGMGVVYEAVQLSLGRRVALKVLPFAAALDSRQLQRFKNEGHAAAQLHHTNIVPVYGVGSDRGIHYYAMQFIDGQTLAQVIDQLKQKESVVGSQWSVAKKPEQKVQQTPATDYGLRTTEQSQPKTLSTESIRDRAFFRTVATLGIQAAEALEHAHQFGVIHRDIKPANLLVEASPLTPQPSPLRLWITDFGLAHCQSNAGLTMTGDLVGTLRYMSPEQALAKRVLVDHRTDIYSLGVTLYELLTLAPAFTGDDRQELLRQIAFEEPRPARRVNPAVPGELETIVLKTMEKNPSDRYATAQDLADDLARFLKDEPIRARRPTWLQRFRKLARRHPGVVATATVALVLVLLLSALGLAANNVMIRDEQERTEAANKRLRDEQERTDAANKRLQGNLKLSLDALEETVVALWFRVPRDLEAKRENEELLAKALAFYERFAEGNQDDPSVGRQVANAYRRAGVLHRRAGHYDKAETAFHRAADVAGRIIADSPQDPDAKWLLAKVHLGTGSLLLTRQGPTGAAEKEYRQGIALLESLGEEAGLDQKNCLSELHLYLGWALYTSGNLAEAEEHSRQGIKLGRQLVNQAGDLSSRLGYMQSLAMHHNDLALVFKDAWRLHEAEEELREQIGLLREVDAQASKLPGYRGGVLPSTGGTTVYRDLAAAHANLGSVLRRQGQSSKAAMECKRAAVLYDQAIRAWPLNPEYQRDLAENRGYWGLLLLEAGKRAEAAKHYREAIAALRTLDARVHENQARLFELLTRMGDLLYVEGDLEKAAEHYREVERLLENMAARASEVAASNHDLARFLVACPDRSFHNPARAVPLAQKAVKLSPKNPDFLFALGVAQYRDGQWQAAVASLNKAKQLRQERDESDWLFLAMSQWRLGDKKPARACYDRAVEILKRYEYPPAEASRWRAEAAALLGLTPDEPKTGKRDKP
jgi:serine/threonine protein kinase/TolA-binding protein